ncbi:carboxylate--amine ligase [Enterococcus timonensis]|uniref:carboxylate--amine ligase n=1 Tax=Enterococcus timonensis TaxID=1852364 RepID=UPI0008DA76E4|nr:carboxylate--amine ligase [Enterococcus timonensis]
MEKNNFDVTLLGSDINVYGMARAFHEKYGMVSQAYAATQLAPTKYSKIVTVHTVPDFHDDQVFANTLIKAHGQLNPEKKHLLIACGDAYAAALARGKATLAPYYEFHALEEDLLEQLVNKVHFYELCQQFQLSHPQTIVIDTPTLLDPSEIKLPFEFPIALKPADSVAWLDISFVGRKKAFRVKDRAEFDTLLLKIKNAGYTGKMICQEFIPGDDGLMHVLNAYVDSTGHVQMMFLGHALLEDPAPGSIGNYMAILPEADQVVYDQIKNFLEQINYRGFANFDMKFDTRDNQYKLFEINPRQGRSSFFVTLNGYNLAEYIVEDLVFGHTGGATVFGTGETLWLGVDNRLFKKYVKDSPAKQKALKLIKKHQVGTTVFYHPDFSVKRWILLKYMFYHYHANFKNYFKENKGE